MRWRALWLVLLLAACGEPPEAPPEAGVRIATTSPAVGIMLRDFGAQDLAVGRSGYDVALDPALPVVGDAAGIDLERLSAVGATHVYYESGASTVPAGLTEMAGDVGFEVRAFELTSLEQLIDLANDVHGLVSGEVDAGQPPGALFEAALEHDEAFADAGRVLLLMPGTPAAVLGPGSVHHEVLVRVGGTPVLDAGRPYMPLDAEDVLEIGPDAIVLLAPGKAEDWRTLLGPLAELPVPAIEAGRVAVLRDEEVLMASTSTLRYAAELRGRLEAWARER
ncbi:MAG: ABC transporter substrate-binding protein [Phycisphaerales bacterium JB060]